MVEEIQNSADVHIQWVKQVGKYFISNQLLGRGEYSEVYLGCFEKNYNKKVACKIMKNTLFESDPYILETINRQNEMLKKINQENVVRFYDMIKTPKNWYFFFEFCSLGTLETYLLKKKGKISEAKALLILLDICEGFKCLYKHNIIHRDLKPANILMSQSGVKISDFSFAKVLNYGEKNNLLQQSLVGTPVYSPLQILEGNAYSSKCDIWSLGVLFYQMLCGRFPFFWKAVARDDLNGGLPKLATEIRKNPLDYPNEVKISKGIKSILEKMLQKEEKTRISWEELFEEVEKLDFNDLSEVPPELKGFDLMNQKETMEKSGLAKGVNMGKSVSFKTLHNLLKASQRFDEENYKDFDVDEGSGIKKVPDFKNIVKTFNNL